MRYLFRNVFYNEFAHDFLDHVELKRSRFTAINPDAFMELDKKEKDSQKLALTNCKNCGAPLHSCTCEYCGTEY